MESAAVAGLGGRAVAVGVKAIGSVDGNGLTRNGRLKAMTSRSRGIPFRKLTNKWNYDYDHGNDC